MCVYDCVCVNLLLFWILSFIRCSVTDLNELHQGGNGSLYTELAKTCSADEINEVKKFVQ